MDKPLVDLSIERNTENHREEDTMKNSTAQIAKAGLVVLTIVCMAVISKVPFINENPVISIVVGVALAIVMGNLMKLVSRKQREHATN